ncbi:MAG TPA: ankyrin repeat domain-containing protein [Vicinamibacterales bacterium]|nr:ankyrin repeat domain-containing protein [Vicinamibacterales bacterium]
MHLATRLVVVCTLSGFVAGTTAAAAQSPAELIDATKRQDVAGVRTLLAKRVDVNGLAADGSTALHWAVQRNNPQLVDLLVRAGANTKASTRYNVPPLYFAALNGNASVMERLLAAGADPNGTVYEGQTMLMTAALSGRPDAVRLLLARGAKVDAVEPYRGQTALMWAASEGNTDAAAVLLEAGASLTAKSTGGFTPLLFAVRNAHLGTAQLLLKHGANVNDAAPDGSSALGMAVVNAYYELAATLLDQGANPNPPDPRGSPLHTVAWLRKPGADGAAGVGNTPQGTPPQTGNVTPLQLAKKLLDMGANPNVRVEWKEPTFGKEGGTARNPPNVRLGRHLLSYNGATPFYVAAKNGDAPLMRLLAEHGANPTTPTKAGITPLMVAAGLDYWEGESPGPFTGVSEAERLDAVKLAIELGNDVNAHAVFGDYRMDGEVEYTLLYYPHNIDELLELNVGDPRWSGSTPLIGAVVSGQPSIVQYLLDRGARPDDRTVLGWTPLRVAQGVFFANAKKEFPAAEAILKKALAAAPAQAAAAQAAVPQAPAAAGGVVYLDRDKTAELMAKGGPLAAGSDYQATAARRTGPGQVEVHDKETDIFYVVDGEATFVTGGKMIGGKLARPNQWLGTTIEGGETRQLKKGDFIVIPAGLPHWFKDVPQAVNYYVVKVVKP